MSIEVKKINKGAQPLPAYQTAIAAGADMYADITDPITLQPLQRQLISTGIFLELPQGYEAQIRPRSGLAFKHGITVLNSPGTIDADYRGEIKILLINLSNENFTIQAGDRIAQIVIAPCLQATWQVENELSQTQRGEGGYGHTGINL